MFRNESCDPSYGRLSWLMAEVLSAKHGRKPLIKRAQLETAGGQPLAGIAGERPPGDPAQNYAIRGGWGPSLDLMKNPDLGKQAGVSLTATR
jgi:hypothetical protein